MPSLCLCIIYLHFKYVQIVYIVCASLARVAAKSKLSYCNARECVSDTLSIFGQVKSRSSMLPKSLSCKWADIYCNIYVCIQMYLLLNLAWGAPVINLKHRHMHDNIWQTYLYTCVTPKRSLFYTIVHTDTDTDSDADAAVALLSAQKTGFSLCVFAVCFFLLHIWETSLLFSFANWWRLHSFVLRRDRNVNKTLIKIENRDKATANALALFAQISR